MLRASCSAALRCSKIFVRHQSTLSKLSNASGRLNSVPANWRLGCGIVARLSDQSIKAPKQGTWKKWVIRGTVLAVFGVGASISMALVIRNDLGKYPMLAKLLDSISGRTGKVTPAARGDPDSGLFPAPDVHIKLLQYHTCPFSSKVRTYLDYYEVPYEIVEVNPISRSELPSDYRKVPIVMAGDYRLVESSVIVSIFESYRVGRGKASFEELNSLYPHHEGERYGRPATIYDDKYLLSTLSEKEHSSPARKEELKWRAWNDDKFVHVLPPNIYRTAAEAKQAFDYISSVGNFGFFEALAAQVLGATVMYMMADRLKKRYELKDDVRESLYDCGNEWMAAVGDRKFLGGDKPNLADLAVFGSLTSVEGFDAFHDLMEHTPMRPWWDRMIEVVRTSKKKTGDPTTVTKA